jgi:hypothetical protein
MGGERDPDEERSHLVADESHEMMMMVGVGVVVANDTHGLYWYSFLVEYLISTCFEHPELASTEEIHGIFVLPSCNGTGGQSYSERNMLVDSHSIILEYI